MAVACAPQVRMCTTGADACLTTHAFPLPNASPCLQGTESELGMQAIWQGRIYCHLRVLVAEQQVLQALTASRFAQVCRSMLDFYLTCL